MTVITAQDSAAGGVPPIDEHRPDPRDPGVRLALLLDPGTVCPLIGEDSSGVQAVLGRIRDIEVVAYCTDATKMGGALGVAGARRIVTAIEEAVARDCPVIGLWHSGGARLADGVESMNGVGEMFAAMTRASGRVPQISVVLGPAAGAAAYGPALTDLIVMSSSGRVFITGPDVVQSVTGEHIDMEGLGGPRAHGKKSGVVHVLVDTQEQAFDRTRELTELMARPGTVDRVAVAAEAPIDPSTLLPARPRRAYDVRPLVRALVDVDSFVEIQAGWAPNIVVGLCRVAGRSAGVVASNPLRMGGCLHSLSAEKAARFVRMCDAFGIPLLVLVDVPGYLPGVSQEWGGVVRRGAKLLHAFAEAVVPRLTLVTRKAYGGAYIAMNSRSLGATEVLAWPNAEVAVMGPEAAVNVLHRKRLALAVDEKERNALRATLVEQQQRLSGGVARGLDLGVIDEVIDPAATRARFAAFLDDNPAARGRHGNIPL